MKSIVRLITSLLLIGLWFTAPARAGDDALYEAPIPADKSLVRFLNAKQAPGMTVTINGQPFEVETDVLSAYKIVSGGEATIDGANSNLKFSFEPKKFYTVVVDGAASGLQPIAVLEDKVAQNRSGSSLSFYNMTAGAADLALKLKGKSKNVFSGVKQGEQAFREIIPVDIGIDVVVDGKVAKSFDSVKLSATDRQSVVAILVGKEVRAFVVPNGIEN